MHLLKQIAGLIPFETRMSTTTSRGPLDRLFLGRGGMQTSLHLAPRLVSEGLTRSFLRFIVQWSAHAAWIPREFDRAVLALRDALPTLEPAEFRNTVGIKIFDDDWLSSLRQGLETGEILVQTHLAAQLQNSPIDNGDRAAIEVLLAQHLTLVSISETQNKEQTMSKTSTPAMTAHKKVEAAAAQAVARRGKEPRFMQHVVGKYARQGDIYIEAIDKISFTKLTKQTQLVTGSSQGSRHVLNATGAKIYECPANKARTQVKVGGREINRLMGPQLEIGRGGAVVEHPEHAHIKLDEGCYQISYQLDHARDQQVRD
jgi:hypothetical protein